MHNTSKLLASMSKWRVRHLLCPHEQSAMFPMNLLAGKAAFSQQHPQAFTTKSSESRLIKAERCAHPYTICLPRRLASWPAAPACAAASVRE